MALPASFGPAEIQRLKDLITDGVRTQDEIQSLKEGLSDTVKAIAEELEIPAKLLKSAITRAQKGDFASQKDDLDDLEKILDSVGRK
jgi:hypothetical protein